MVAGALPSSATTSPSSTPPQYTEGVSQDHWDLHREFNPMHPDCNKSQALVLHVQRSYNNASPPCPIKPEWNWHRCAHKQREAGNSNLTKAGGGPTSNMNVKSREIFLCLKSSGQTLPQYPRGTHLVKVLSRRRVHAPAEHRRGRVFEGRIGKKQHLTFCGGWSQRLI